MVTIIPVIIEKISDFIPKPSFPKIYKTLYFKIIDMVEVKNNLFVFPMACSATDKVGCIYKIKKNGPIK